MAGGPLTGGFVAGVLLAGAALCWPSPPRRPGPLVVRGAAGRGGPGRGSSAGGRSGLRWVSLGAVVGALVGASALAAAAILAGPAGLLAAAMMAATGTLLGRRLLAERRRRQALPDILRGLRTLNRELRAGSDPVTAVEAAGRSCGRVGAQVLGRLALLMQAPGPGAAPEGDSNGDSVGDSAHPADRVLDVLCSGWLLCRRHGVAFGRVVSGIADELADEVTADEARAAQLAGPRMSGYVMAGLPLMGVLLGAGMGVNPIGVLLGSAAGHLLLLVGVALMCAGLLWSARIVGR